MAVADPAAQNVAAPDASTGGLHRRALGVPDLVFFIVAASAPLTAVAGGQAATYLVTGNRGIPFLFIPLAIILGVFAVGTAFGALVSYNAMQVGIYGLFGVATAAFMSDKVGITLDWYWWCLIGGAIIAVLGVLQIDLNAKVLAIFLTLEIIIVALFDLAILADPGPQGLTTIGWRPSVATDS